MNESQKCESLKIKESQDQNHDIAFLILSAITQLSALTIQAIHIFVSLNSQHNIKDLLTFEACLRTPSWSPAHQGKAPG